MHRPAAKVALVVVPLLLSVLPVAALDAKKLGLDQALDAKLQPALVPVPEQPGLPRVLLIGDSISIGYTREVRELLKGVANVQRPAENCGPTVWGLDRLDAWLGQGKWDVIHFNFGLHDLKYLDAEGKYITPGPGDRPVATPEQYAENLRALIKRLKKTGARLIFATTTPVPGESLGRVEESERAYNTAALAVMQQTGVAVDDLWSYARAHPDLQLPHNVHFTPEGSTALAHEVATSVRQQLP